MQIFNEATARLCRHDRVFNAEKIAWVDCHPSLAPTFQRNGVPTRGGNRRLAAQNTECSVAPRWRITVTLYERE